MGAVPVLIMLAAVGVDYGWRPDGTTSPRGDNLQYIVQIDPQQLDQIRSTGEITSTIDPAIQGRVSQIVVQIGTGPLPRDAGRAISSMAPAATTVTQAVALDEDAAQIPIPEIVDSPLAARASRPFQETALKDGTGSQSLMKPDPQSGGFKLPESLENPVRTNPEVSTDPASRSNSWDDLSGRASVTRSAAASSPDPASGIAPPSTDPVDSAARTQAGAAGTNALGQSRQRQADPTTVSPATTDVRRGTTAQPPAAVTGSVSSDSFTMPTTTGSSANRPLGPDDPNWSGYGLTPNFGAMPPGLNNSTTITKPATDSAFANPSPGAAPTDTQRQPAVSAQSISEYTGQVAAAVENYGRDAFGNALDKLGRAIDNQGRLIDARTRQLVDEAGNTVDEYGRLIDRLGRPSPAEPAASNPPPSNAQLQPPAVPTQQPTAPAYAPPGGYAGATGGQYQPAHSAQPPQSQPYPPSSVGSVQPNYPTAPGYTSGAGYNPGTGYNPGAGYPQGNPQLAPQYNVAQSNPAYPANSTTTYTPPAAPATYPPLPTTSETRPDPRPSTASDYSRGGRNFDEDDFRSPSDTRRDTPSRSSTTAAGQDRDLAAPSDPPVATRPRTVAAQPFFTFVLLISLVGNAYLIYETGNLRRKFRNMIASVRAAKLATQPANS